MTRQYLKLIRKVLRCPSVPNRTGIDARSNFGHQMKFCLRNDTLPIVTTKPMNFNIICKELLWFMRGNTNQKILEDQGVKIWKANASRAYLDSRGLYSYKENVTLGPIYGFQWRHFGARYVDAETNYNGDNGGIDQLKDVIDTIKNDPTSRRIIMTSWNPIDLKKMALPPCHVLVQFYVNNGELSAHLYQRSADLMLGVPFNFTSYSLLVHILAKMCGLKAGDFIHSFGDVHIYENHVEQAKQQLLRTPQNFPKLEMNFGTTTIHDVDYILDNLNSSQFKLLNYKFDKRRVYFDMAV